MAEKNELLPAYLIVGPDELKRRQALTRLKARVDGPFSAFNLEEVVATGDLEPEDVIASLNTLPMGGDRRIVVIENGDKLPKAVSEALVTYLADPNPSCTLALVAEKLAKNTRLYKALARVGKKAVIECALKKGRDLPPYVQKLAAAHGVSIGVDAARELVARAGESTTMLDTQIASLAALLGGSGTITREFVEANVARVVEVKPWEFLNCLAGRDAARALSLYRLLDGSALGLLSLITGRLREIVCARSLVARGQRHELMSALGKREEWQVKDHVAWARRYADGELEHLLAECAEAERALKSGADGDAVLVPLIARICGVA